MKNIPFMALLALVLIALFSPHAVAQKPELSPHDEHRIALIMEWQDQMVLTQFSLHYIRDYRYDGLLNHISEKFNEKVSAIFPHYNKEVYFSVFVSPLGFNACTWNKLIIFDSLLMDSLRKLSQGIACFGTMDNSYTRELAMKVLQRGEAQNFGRIAGNFTDGRNPFSLPSPETLTPEEQRHADLIFESMIAAVAAHEASHAFLDHIRDKLLLQKALSLYNQGKSDPEELNRYIDNYINYTLSNEKELEADTYAARLARASGYDIDGFIYWLQFCDILEELTGTRSQQARTHPTPQARIATVRKSWNSLPRSKNDAARPRLF
jgi:hypothetical protein